MSGSLLSLSLPFICKRIANKNGLSELTLNSNNPLFCWSLRHISPKLISASHARNRRSIPLGLLLLNSGQKKTAPKQKFRCGFKKCFLFSSQGEVSFSFTSSNCYFLRRFTHIRLPCGNFVFTGWKAINLESTISSCD